MQVNKVLILRIVFLSRWNFRRKKPNPSPFSWRCDQESMKRVRERRRRERGIPWGWGRGIGEVQSYEPWKTQFFKRRLFLLRLEYFHWLNRSFLWQMIHICLRYESELRLFNIPVLVCSYSTWFFVAQTGKKDPGTTAHPRSMSRKEGEAVVCGGMIFPQGKERGETKKMSSAVRQGREEEPHPPRRPKEKPVCVCTRPHTRYGSQMAGEFYLPSCISVRG